MPRNTTIPSASELRGQEALECFPFCESPILAWMMVGFPERKEQCCPCGGYGLSLQLVWAAVGCISLVCDPLGELWDVSGTPFTYSEVWNRGTEADGAVAGPSTVLCLAGREDFSAQEQQLWMHSVNAPGLHCTIHGWFRILSSMSLPSSQLLLGISSVVLG